MPAKTKEVVKKVFKGTQEFEHSLFKLELATFLKNTSYKFMRPEIQNVEHVHFYHSVNKQGKPNKYCSPVAGHFHEMSVEWDGEEIKKMVCGPPLTMKKIKIPGTTRAVKKITEVVYERIDMNTGERSDVVDKHIHEMSYIHTETINPIAQKKAVQSEKEKIQSMMDSSRIAEQAANYTALQRGELSNSKGAVE
jgi:hypothetical protein